MFTIDEAIEALRRMGDPEIVPYTFTGEDAETLTDIADFLEQAVSNGDYRK